MRLETDPLHPLLPTELLKHMDQAQMPYTGYHLLRDALTPRLLGESEAPILYWLGQDLGKEIRISSFEGLVLTFIRLGLGKLDIVQTTENTASLTLFHPLFPFLESARLERSLSFECGLLAGAISRWKERKAHAELSIQSKEHRAELALIALTW